MIVEWKKDSEGKLESEHEKENCSMSFHSCLDYDDFMW